MYITHLYSTNSCIKSRTEYLVNSTQSVEDIKSKGEVLHQAAKKEIGENRSHGIQGMIHNPLLLFLSIY